MRILVTGNAGFIGFHVARRLIERGDDVVGVDSLDPYYDPDLKLARLAELDEVSQRLGAEYRFERLDLADSESVKRLFEQGGFERVIHLAAQPGVRYSLENPHAYVRANLIAFTNLLEACRHESISHLTFASTSSVYGASEKMPYAESDCASHPLQFYAATKRANELMAHAYSHLYGLPATGLRFFTVYGPWGRPDMAPWLFAQAIAEGKPIRLHNKGDHLRDFTYIDDAVECVIRANDSPPSAASAPQWDAKQADPGSSASAWRILNIGNSSPAKLAELIEAIESAVGRKAILEPVAMQPGDAYATFCDSSRLREAIGFSPSTPLGEGIKRFVEWRLQWQGKNAASSSS